MKALKILNIENLKQLDKNVEALLNHRDLKALISDKKLYSTIGLNYGIIYNYDSVQYGKIEELNFELDNILEARFFDDNREVVILNDGNTISGNIVDLNDKCDFKADSYYIGRDNKYKKLKVKKLIDFNQDNAAYVYYLKPCSLEGGDK